MSHPLLVAVNDAVQQLFNHVGLVEGWSQLPISDCTSKFWRTDGFQCVFADSLDELRSETGNYYEEEVLRSVHFPQSVYRGSELTLVILDTHSDGNQYYSVFDNSKETPAG